MKSRRKIRSRIIAFLISSIMMATTFVNDYTIAYAEEDIRISDSSENATEDSKNSTTESTGESSKTESADGNSAAESATKSEEETAGATKSMEPGTELNSGTELASGTESDSGTELKLGTAPESGTTLEPGTDPEPETKAELGAELETAELEPELEINPELLIEEEQEMDYPPQSFTGSASNGIYVEASVEEGVFPAGTIMIVTAVSDSRAMEAVEDSASEGKEIVAAKAVDITFTDAEGKEIQPADGKKVHVSLSSSDAVEGDSHAVFHVDEDGSAERVASASATGAAFDGASFSIYVLAGEKPIADRITFQFMNGDTLYDCQIVKDGETLYEPELPVSETGDFLGWYEGDTRFEGFGTVTVSETKTVTLTARFNRTYHVYFYGADGVTVQATKNVQDGESVSTTDVTIAVDASKALVGWSASQNGTTAVGDTVTVRGADIKLYPIIKEVKWVTFDTDGGSVVAPVYVSEGQTAVRPANPTRAGYTFEKWVVKGSSPQQEYTFTEKVTENITLLAKWKANAASYTIVYWAEDAEDDAYETFIKTETVTGLSDAAIEASDVSRKVDAVTWDKKSYFTYNKTKTEAALGSAKISGDGTTVVNVYFSRNRYTITFDLGNRSYNQMTIGGKTYTGNSKTKYQLTAKYEQNIETMWPTASNFQSGNDFYGWDNVEKDFCQVSKVLTMTENLCTTGGKTAKAVYGTNCLDHLYYMFESFDQTSGANGNNRVKYKGIYYDKSVAYSQDANSTGGDWNAKLISGMKNVGVESKTLRTTGWFNEKPAERNVFLYYSRNSYELSYYNYNQTVKTETIKFGADLTGKYSFTPARPAALSDVYVFQGWYTTPGCLEGTEAPRKLTEMPAGNTIVYAKWATPVYTVSFDLNGAAGTIEPQTVSYGAKAVEPETPVRAGYTFGGWTYADGTLFHFSTKITANTSLKAQWIYDGILYVAYDAITNGGAGAPMDANQYVETTYATVLRAPTTNPTGKVFLGWALDGKTYYPGETFRVSETLAKDVNGKKVITLVAIYGDKPAATELVYAANNGTDATKTFSVQRNSYITIKDITDSDIGFTYEYHKFLGWKDGEGTLYKSGDRVVIDNVTNHILTAQWEEIKYTVAFYDRDPSDPEAVLLSMKNDYHYHDNVTAPAAPSPYEDPGYDYGFRGWKAEDGRVYQAGNLPRVTGNAVYFADYSCTPKTFTIEYKGLENAVVKENRTTYTVETETFTLNNPVKAGYTFLGWIGTGLGDAASKAVTIAKGSTGNRIYTATWSANTDTPYTVKHHLQTLEDANKYVLKDTEHLTGKTDTQVTPKVKAYEGFTAPAAQTITITGDGKAEVNYYYDRKTYTVTALAGTGTTNVTGSNTYLYGASVTVDAEVLNGYTWSGWSGDLTSGDKQFTFTMPAKNVTLTAQATINRYQLTIDPAGGTWDGKEPPSELVLNYQETKDIQPAERVGYTFNGWTLKGEDSSQVRKAQDGTITFTMGYENATLTANWTANTDTRYVVNHFKQKLDGTYPEVADETENKTGVTGERITPEVKSYEGFTSPDVQTKTIAANGSTVVDYYYTRNTYTITVLPNPEEAVKPLRTGAFGMKKEYDQKFELPYGEDLSKIVSKVIEYTIQGDYYFTNWSLEGKTLEEVSQGEKTNVSLASLVAGEKMPAHNELIIYANYAQKTVVSLSANGEYVYDGKQHEAVIDYSSAEALKVNVAGVKAV
ncbi:MAG: InlB B-repeat-containing protein, partial [Lachnospiraceae bacterium]